MINKEQFLNMYKINEEELKKENISWKDLKAIHDDFINSKKSYETQADLVANILRAQPKVHSVKTRVKDVSHLIEKVIRKTPERRAKYGQDFNFTAENYKDEITDLLGIRVIHIFKEDWEEIHNFITNMWEVMEIVANVREGDDTTKFDEQGIAVCSRPSGYRSVHYLLESYPTNKKLITEVQVRTIFEEGYGEIDHQLRYSHEDIPDLLGQNLMLLNRIAGSSDEMASLINRLSQSIQEVENKFKAKIHEKDKKIESIKEKIYDKEYISDVDKKNLINEIDDILKIK
ncbi:RelA/SpoT domain-containing protein [Terrisporobacter petrolearius]|uniref:RelA/SpoT domain-containing protein n=1 Tax=Terrisporobacter petrolearius TaxID=1460447 RepID=UPI001D16263B|nr:RelA/SpoT domain-containing protein [Terrisporobacter petrolearius]MCC3864370.1 RelA/SpoT domain-containing protein [Terrisporobacter petrolearius]